MKLSGLKPEQEKQGSHFLFGGAMRKQQKTVSSYLIHSRHDWTEASSPQWHFSQTSRNAEATLHVAYTQCFFTPPQNTFTAQHSKTELLRVQTPHFWAAGQTSSSNASRKGWSAPTTSLLQLRLSPQDVTRPIPTDVSGLFSRPRTSAGRNQPPSSSSLHLLQGAIRVPAARFYRFISLQEPSTTESTPRTVTSALAWIKFQESINSENTWKGLEVYL